MKVRQTAVCVERTKGVAQVRCGTSKSTEPWLDHEKRDGASITRTGECLDHQESMKGGRSPERDVVNKLPCPTQADNLEI